MNTYSRGSIFWLTMAMIAVSGALLTGCGGGGSPPSTGDVLNHLNGTLPITQPYAFTDVQPTFIPQSDGSIVIKGTLTGKLKEDLYEQVSYNDRLRELGFDAPAWQRAVQTAQSLRDPYKSTLLAQIPDDIKNNQFPSVIRVATHSGSDLHFDFSTTAQKAQTGWSFGLDSVNPTDNARGQTRTNFGNDVYVIDSDDEKKKSQGYISFCQNFAKLVTDAQTAIAAEDEKYKQRYLQSTAIGKNYVGSFNTDGGPYTSAGTWPLGFTITEQQVMGTGVVIKGFLFDPDTPTRKRSFSGTLQLVPGGAQDKPIHLHPYSAFASLGQIRQGNMTDMSMSQNCELQLAVDDQGNLSGILVSQWGHLLSPMSSLANFTLKP